MTISLPTPKDSWAAALFLLAVWGFSQGACAQGERCGESKDFEVQALEQIKTRATWEVDDSLQLLKYATEVCASFGDAWYCRSPFERKLGQVPKANYSLDAAKLFGSQAMDDGPNPFVLAAPAWAIETKLPPVRNKWALVVGISQFSDARLSLVSAGNASPGTEQQCAGRRKHFGRADCESMTCEHPSAPLRSIEAV